MSPVSLRVPPISVETHQCFAEQDGMSSRAQLARGSGPYESTVPPKIANLQLEVPALLAADVEDAVSALVRFSTTTPGIGWERPLPCPARFSSSLQPLRDSRRTQAPD
jgi:hypothetical protein